jgi:hypothetical protein
VTARKEQVLGPVEGEERFSRRSVKKEEDIEEVEEDEEGRQ